MSAEPSLFPLRIRTIYPGYVNGADVVFSCDVDRGGTYYCKADKPGRLIRATEWFSHHLANHIGLATPECAIIEDQEGAETLFGSRQVPSPASQFEVRAFLGTPQRGELGQPAEWPGRHLSGLYAFDLFVGNPDRSLENFLLYNEGLTRRLCAFDFASCNLAHLAGHKFPVASDATIRVGRFLRHTHGFWDKAAFEIIDRLAAVPGEILEGVLNRMPPDWMSVERREAICELWSKKRLGGRLTAMRSGLADGSLL